MFTLRSLRSSLTTVLSISCLRSWPIPSPPSIQLASIPFLFQLIIPSRFRDLTSTCSKSPSTTFVPLWSHDPFVNSWRDDGLYRYFTLLSQLSLPARTQPTRPSPSFAVRLVRSPALLGSCHLITLFSVHQRTSSLKSPHPQDSRWTVFASLGLNIEMALMNPHAHGRCWSQRMARPLHSRSASVRSFPLSPCLMFVCLYLVLGRVPAAVTSIPSGVRTNVQHPLGPFLTFTTCACGMTTHDCTLTQMAMFIYFSLPNMPHECRPVLTTAFGWRENRFGNVAIQGWAV